MTDHQLLRLLREKPAANLSPDEIASIRARWISSPEFRLACGPHAEFVATLAGGDHAEAWKSNPAATSLAASRLPWIVLSSVCVMTLIGLAIWLSQSGSSVMPVGQTVVEKAETINVTRESSPSGAAECEDTQSTRDDEALEAAGGRSLAHSITTETPSLSQSDSSIKQAVPEGSLVNEPRRKRDRLECGQFLVDGRLQEIRTR